MCDRISGRELQEPICPYIGTTYNTLVSVAQGFALASLTISAIPSAFQNGNLSWQILLKIIVFVSIVSLIWHRYVTQNQYVIWEFGALDTLIPIILATLQLWVAHSIEMKLDGKGQFTPTSIFEFSKSISFLTLFGILAYIYANLRTDRITKHFINEHFLKTGLPSIDKLSDEGKAQIKRFSEDFYNEIKGFYKLSLLFLLFFCACSFLFTYCWVGNPNNNYFLDENHNTVIAFFYYIIMCGVLFHFDFRYVLHKSESELLKKFRWKHEWNILNFILNSKNS